MPRLLTVDHKRLCDFKTMDFTFRMNSYEEGEDRKVGRKGGHNFLGCTRYNSYYSDYFPSKQTINNYTALLHSIIGYFKETRKNISIWRRRKCSSIKIMHGFMPGTDGQIQRIPLRIAFPLSIFARFPLRLFLVSKPEEMVRRKEIHHQRAAHRRNRGLF